jgi:hypothetical protein
MVLEQVLVQELEQAVLELVMVKHFFVFEAMPNSNNKDKFEERHLRLFGELRCVD